MELGLGMVSGEWEMKVRRNWKVREREENGRGERVNGKEREEGNGSVIDTR